MKFRKKNNLPYLVTGSLMGKKGETEWNVMGYVSSVILVACVIWDASGWVELLRGTLMWLSLGWLIETLISEVVERINQTKFRGYNEPPS